MANPIRGEVEITIGGKDRILRYTMNALANASKTLGIDRMSNFVDAIQDPAPDHLQYLLWLGLLHEEPRLKLKEVGEWEFIWLPTIAKVAEAVMTCFNGGNTLGDDAEKEESSDPL